MLWHRIPKRIQIRVHHIIALSCLCLSLSLISPELAYAQVCDDYDPCTTDIYMGPSLGCVNMAIPGCTPCTQDTQCADPDSNRCTGTYSCDLSRGLCTLDPSTVITCDTSADTTCKSNQCDAVTGLCYLWPSNEGGTCDDGDACTTNDSCFNGQCLATDDICECHFSSDCPQDGDLCNGELFCDTRLPIHKCVTNLSTQIRCSSGNNTPCQTNTCQPATGACVMVPQPGSCDDGDRCTIDDMCSAGVCNGTPDIGPGKTCGCKSSSDCALQEDNNLCNGTLYCDRKTDTCLVNPTTIVTCPDVNNNACRLNTCDPTDGVCAMSNLVRSCDDNNPCTINDTCVAGSCAGTLDVGGAASVCECQQTSDCAALEDGNLCNGTLYCDKLRNICVLNPATVIEQGGQCASNTDCADFEKCAGAINGVNDTTGVSVLRLGICTGCPTSANTECSISSCNPQTGACGFGALANGSVCTGDGDVCTINDQCTAGSCTGTADIGPNGTCACRTNADCIDDGDLCNGTPYCELSDHSCRVNPATIVSCPSVNDTMCSVNRCDPLTGTCSMLDEPNTKSCSDGHPCTVGDSCSAGLCAPGPDTCACRVEADCPDDANLCNGSTYCDKSKLPWSCKTNPSTVVQCYDLTPDNCYATQCDPLTGTCTEQQVPNQDPCSDGNACTASDQCQDGLCSGSTACMGNALCTVAAGGQPNCTCMDGWQPEGSCDVPVFTDPCSGIDAYGQCNGNDRVYCNQDQLITENCTGYAYIDAQGVSKLQNGFCVELPQGARCVFGAGQYCAGNVSTTFLGCGSASGLNTDMGCDLADGCVAGLGTCDVLNSNYVTPPRCVGNRRVYTCNALGQAVSVNCASVAIGSGTCFNGVCVGLTLDSTCVTGAFECTTDYVCISSTNASGIGRCMLPPPPDTPVEQCSAEPTWLGDGYCDEIANVALCGYDNGDCCQSTCVSSGFYACGANGFNCLDPNATVQPVCNVDPTWIADGFCDEIANIELCSWDGGDCCASTCVSAAYQCDVLGIDCLDPAASNTSPVENCAVDPSWIGDAYCDANANIEACLWDGGDCCPSTCTASFQYDCGTNGYDCQGPSSGTNDGGSQVDGSGSGDAQGDAMTGDTVGGDPDGDMGTTDAGPQNGDNPMGDDGAPYGDGAGVSMDGSPVGDTAPTDTPSSDTREQPNGDARRVPSAWTCTFSWYGGSNGCDCACGVRDPDCDDPSVELKNCPNDAVACDTSGACVIGGTVDLRVDSGLPTQPDPGGGTTGGCSALKAVWYVLLLPLWLRRRWRV